MKDTEEGKAQTSWRAVFQDYTVGENTFTGPMSWTQHVAAINTFVAKGPAHPLPCGGDAPLVPYPPYEVCTVRRPLGLVAACRDGKVAYGTVYTCGYSAGLFCDEQEPFSDGPALAGYTYVFQDDPVIESEFIIGEKCPISQLTEVDSDDHSFANQNIGYTEYRTSLNEQYHAGDPAAAELTRQLEAANGKAFGGPISTEMMRAMECIETRVAAAGGGTNRESGHRTLAYNKHLQEVWDKREALWPVKDMPACKELFRVVDREKTTHKLAYRPHDASLHTRKPAQAFDLQFYLPPGQSIDAIACQCNAYRFCVTKDPTHFDHLKPIRVCERDDRRTLGRTPQEVMQQCPAL